MNVNTWIDFIVFITSVAGAVIVTEMIVKVETFFEVLITPVTGISCESAGVETLSLPFIP